MKFTSFYLAWLAKSCKRSHPVRSMTIALVMFEASRVRMLRHLRSRVEGHLGVIIRLARLEDTLYTRIVRE
jgi:hypothetical protein